MSNKNRNKIWCSLRKKLSGMLILIGILATMSIPVSAGDYYIYSQFDPVNIDDVTGVGGYVEYQGIPDIWGDEIQYVYFLSGNTGYKVKVTLKDGDGDGKIEPRQHPDNKIPEFQGPIEPRNFEIVSSKDLTGYTYGSSGHTEEFYIDSSGIYLGAYPYGINKWSHNWNYIGKIANSPPVRTESLAYNPGKNEWYAGGRSRTIYELKDTNNDGSFLDESWRAIFTYPDYSGNHHDGLEYVGGYLWISDMTSDVIGKWWYNPSTDKWEELNKFTYTEGGDVEGMGFGPNDHFWIGSGWGSGSYIYELGNEITKGYPIANAGKDIENYAPTIPVKFDGSASHHTDPSKQIVSYQWDFDGDRNWDSTNKIDEYIYPAFYNPDGSIDWDKTKKDYIVTLKVTDNSNPSLSATDTTTVHITAPPWKPVAIPNPNPDPDNNPYVGTVGTPVQLDGSKSYDPEEKKYSPGDPWYEKIAKYEWDLDFDGQYDDAHIVNPTWTWNKEGIYNIKLKVTDSQPSGPGGTFGDLDIDEKIATVIIKKESMISEIIEPENNVHIAESNGPSDATESSKTQVNFKGKLLCNNCQSPYDFYWNIDGNIIIRKSNSIEDEFPYEFYNSGEHVIKLYVKDYNGKESPMEEKKFDISVNVAYIPVIFKDGKSNHKNMQELKDRAQKVKDYYYKQSYKKENLNNIFIVDDWYKLPNTLNYYDTKYTQCNKFTGDSLRSCVALELIDELISSDSYNIKQYLQQKAKDLHLSGGYQNTGFSSFALITPEYGTTIRPSSWPGRFVVNDLALVITDFETYKYPNGYGVWTHELGHSQYGYRDYYSLLRYWGLMGKGVGNEQLGLPDDPPTDIVSYNKEIANWLEYEKINKGDKKNVKLLEDMQPPNDKTQRYYATQKNSCIESYIFDGRNHLKGTDILRDGILIYQIDKTGKDALLPKVIEKIDGFTTLYAAWPSYAIPSEGVEFYRHIIFGELEIKDYKSKNTRTVEMCMKSDFPSYGEFAISDPNLTAFDINLYAISNSKIIGLNKISGNYEQIEDAITSGNVYDAGAEWITLPNNKDAYYMIDASFAKKWAEENGITLPNMVVSMQMILYDENGARLESIPVEINVNLENPTIIKLSDLLPDYRIKFLPPLTIANRTNITNRSTLPIKFAISNKTGQFVADNSTKVIITDSKNNMITKFVNGTGAKNLRINTTDETYIANFNTRNYDLNIGEKYTIIVTFGKDKLLGYASKDFYIVK